MKPFETQYTKWVDGLLTGRELEEFERALGERRAVAEQDRAEARKLGDLLRRYDSEAAAPALANADFFNHEIARQIEAQPASSTAPRLVPLWRLIWAGGSCLGVAALLFFSLVLPGQHPVKPAVDYYAQILNTQPGDPAISAVAFHSDKDNVTVLWLDGLDYMPTTPVASASHPSHR